MRRTVAALLLLAVVAGCPRPPVKKKGDGTTVTVDGDPPDFPDGFTPDAPLPDPLPPDPKQFGLAYLEVVYTSLGTAWSQFLEDARLRLPPDDPLNRPTLETKLELTIDRNGALVDVQRLSGSGNSDFDGTAEEIVREAAPFPAPPQELLSDDELVHATWLFARDRRQAGVATAELRRVEWPLDQAVPKLLEEGKLPEAARRIIAAAEGASAKTPEGEQLLALTERVMVAALRDGLLVEDPALQAFGIAAVDAAARATPSIAPAARELLAIATGSVEIENRAAAIDALAALGHRDAVAMIAGILEKDEGGNPRLSGAAAAALVALGDGDETASLVATWLGSGDRAKIGGALASLSYAAVPGTAKHAAKHISAKDVGVRVHACKALGRQATISADATTSWKALRKGLDDRDATVRAACAGAASVAAAAGSKNRAAYWRMIELLKDKDERVRAAAVGAAIRLDPKTVPQLGKVSKDKSTVVLAALAEGLEYAAAPTPKRLIELAGHADVEVRVAAVRALAGRDADARAIAAKAVVDPEQEVRLAAISAIDDAEPLESLAGDADSLIAAAAQARGIVVRGRWLSVPVALGVLMESAGRVDVAAAWLRAS